MTLCVPGNTYEFTMAAVAVNGFLRVMFGYNSTNRFLFLSNEINCHLKGKKKKPKLFRLL